MTSAEIRSRFLDFWTSGPRNCKQVPNVSLVPNNDSTLLFVNSGMFPLNPYLAGQPHPLGDRLCNFQRCLRTNYDEMLEIGDNRHTLMFEMMGDWSLGAFTKAEQIPWIMSFWVEVCGLDPRRIYVSVFAGDDVVPRDEEAIRIWQQTFAKYGVVAEFTEDITKIPPNLELGETWPYRIFPYPKKKNWWQRAGDVPGELGGPTSEMFYDMGKIAVEDEMYHINDNSGRFIEIGNNVFMEYRFGEDRQWHPLDRKNIDFGGGFERVVMLVQNKEDIFETDIFASLLLKITELSGKPYKIEGKEYELTKYFRILADHARAATFILADGVLPSNKDQGYILRRFIRRLVRFGWRLGIQQNFTANLAQVVIDSLHYAYPHLQENKDIVLTEIDKEEVKFKKTLDGGLKTIQKLKQSNQILDGKLAFYIYETFGFPLELTLDEFNLTEDSQVYKLQQEFNQENQKHRELSKLSSEQKFRGGLADQSERVVALHTAHHLLLRALQLVLGNSVKQRGSNITGERLRLDFNYDTKVSVEQLKQVEAIVNAKIAENLPVQRIEMPLVEAQKIGAEMEFGQKYPEIVSVYYIGNDLESAFSKEFCGGPHVANTGELAKWGKFVILKEESSGQGIRRIKATLK